MRKIADTLVRMADANRAFRSAATDASQDGGAAVVSLRLEYDSECSQFLVHLSSELAGWERRALFHALQDAFGTMRQKLALHQARWDSARIRSDPAGYRNSCLAVHMCVTSFIGEALEQIAEAGGPALRLSDRHQKVA